MGTYHSHPSGEKNGSFFIQNPSSEDYTNANNRAIQHQMIGTNMVFGMKDKMVYLYNAAGNKATISLETFLNGFSLSRSESEVFTSRWDNLHPKRATENCDPLEDF